MFFRFGKGSPLEDGLFPVGHIMFAMEVKAVADGGHFLNKLTTCRLIPKRGEQAEAHETTTT